MPEPIVKIEDLHLSLVGGAGPVNILRGIDLSVTLAKDRVRVDFHDRGPGVPPEIAARIFEPHFTTKGGGMGLGLALVRSVCTLHGGDVRLLDAAVGAHFEIELPLAGPEETA